MVLEENQFLARSLANGIARSLSEEELAAYYAHYASPESRRPLLQWPREIPIDGEPADVAAIVARYDDWLSKSEGVPKLMLAFESPADRQASPTGSASLLAWARDHVAALELRTPGVAAHHAPEDLPREIGETIVDWLARHDL